MKHIVYLTLALLAITAVSCKKDNWIDWKTQNEIWLEANRTKEGVHTTPSGLQYKVLYPGNKTDTRPVTGSTVIMDYKLMLIDEKVKEETQNFSAVCVAATSGATSGLIQGMVEGLKKMYVGADYILYIPWDLAYGKDGSGTEGYSSFIPPYSTLIFEIHLSRVY